MTLVDFDSGERFQFMRPTACDYKSLEYATCTHSTGWETLFDMSAAELGIAASGWGVGDEGSGDGEPEERVGSDGVEMAIWDFREDGGGKGGRRRNEV